MKRVNKELIDFFQMQDREEKNKLLADYIAEAEKQIGFESTVPDNEIRLICETDKALPGTLQNFASILYDKILEGVCNVIATA
ncbi:MAG: hypothetical protein VB064_13670 [Oscillospiraceae bacterium]|nr:hypothetical protein [Oscillospiraceae bacterium]